MRSARCEVQNIFYNTIVMKMSFLEKIAIFSVCAIFVSMAAMTSVATYNYDCACSKKALEGMDNNAAALSSAEHYILSSLIAQIEKDDPDFEYEFDVKSMLHIGGAHATYASLLNSDKSIADKISGVKALLADEPVNKYMEKAFTDPPPDTK
jgi:hypothetical protein